MWFQALLSPGKGNMPATRGPGDPCGASVDPRVKPEGGGYGGSHFRHHSPLPIRPCYRRALARISGCFDSLRVSPASNAAWRLSQAALETA